MRISLKILGFISAVILLGSLIVMNAQPVSVDLIFVEGNVALFLVIIASFLAGFFACLTFLWLKNMILLKKKSKEIVIKPDDIFGDF